MKLGKTALYYKENPEARKKKSEYDKRFQKKREQVKKRVECNKFNRKNKKYGNGDKMDCSHRNGRLTYESQKANRARGGKNKS